MRLPLGSEDRERYAGNMANAGPVELRIYAEEAIRENDKAKGAAVLARVDRLPRETKKSLNFTKTEIAEPLVFTEFNAAIETLVLSEFAILMAGQEAREALGATLNPGDSIAVGAKRAEVELEIGREIKTTDFDVTPVTGKPTEKKTEKKPAENSEDQAQFLKDSARFHALYTLDKRTPEETAEALRLGKKLDILADEGDSK